MTNAGDISLIKNAFYFEYLIYRIKQSEILFTIVLPAYLIDEHIRQHIVLLLFSTSLHTPGINDDLFKLCPACNNLTQ